MMNNSYKLNYMNPDYPPGVIGEYQELTHHMTSVTNRCCSNTSTNNQVWSVLDVLSTPPLNLALL
jgi:hypothetical protein